MKFAIPYFKQTTKTNCGPTALRMALSYFKEDPGIKILEEKTELKKGKGLLTIKMAMTAKLYGYKVEFDTLHLTLNPENLKLDFYKNFLDNDSETSKNNLEKARSMGIILNEKSLTLKEILDKINQNCLAIILLDWTIILDRQDGQFRGHFVPISGYDDEFIYVHSPDIEKENKFLPIKIKTFEKARKSQGTDEDILFIEKFKPL